MSLFRPSRTWRDVRPEFKLRRITDIAERPLTVSINEYATLRFAGTKANSRGFHETLFILAFAGDLSRAHRAQSQGPRAGRGGGREPLEGRAARSGVPRSQSDDGASRLDRRRRTDPFELLAIIEYLDETHPNPPLLPRDVVEGSIVKDLGTVWEQKSPARVRELAAFLKPEMLNHTALEDQLAYATMIAPELTI